MNAFVLIVALVVLVVPIIALVVALSNRNRLDRIEQALQASGKMPVTRPEPLATVQPQLSPSRPDPLETVRPAAAPAKPDWEGRLGGQVANRAGAVAMIVAAVFFLSHAYENDWLAPWGPLLLGLGEGLAFLFGGLAWTRRGARFFGQGVAGAGLAILFATIYVAHHVAGLMPTAMAFGAMLAITALGTFVSTNQKSQAVAVVAIAGGFLAPVLIEPETGPFVLIAYLVPLNLLALVLSARMEWRWLDAIALAGTNLVWVRWVEAEYERHLYPRVLGAQAINFFLFLLAVPARRWPRGLRLGAADLGLWSGAAAAMLLWGLWLFDVDGREGVGFLAVALSVIYIALHVVVRSRDESLLAEQGTLAIAIVLALVAVPLELDGPAVTLLWFLSAAFLIWLGGRSNLDWMQRGAIVVVGLALVHMVAVDLDDHPGPSQPLTAHGIILLLAAASLAVCAWLSARTNFRWNGWSMARWLGVAAGAAGLAVITAELSQHPWVRREWSSDRNDFGEVSRLRRRWSQTAVSVAWALYASAAVWLGIARGWAAARWFGILLFGAMVLKVVTVDLGDLPPIYRVASFFVAGAALLGVSWLYRKRASE